GGKQNELLAFGRRSHRENVANDFVLSKGRPNHCNSLGITSSWNGFEGKPRTIFSNGKAFRGNFVTLFEVDLSGGRGALDQFFELGLRVPITISHDETLDWAARWQGRARRGGTCCVK